MIYTAAIDTFYLTDTQLQNSPSRSEGIDESTETTLRIYGCDLIQESGILLKLPQAVMATGQVLFHRFYCKKSFSRFNVKIVAATCIWLASKLEENPRKRRHVIIVFHRMECRRENLPIVHMDIDSKKYVQLKEDLNRTERSLLKEIGFVCHVEHPHKFILNYLATLEAPTDLRQEAWNLVNDSLRTTLCVRFPSEVVACGVVYAAARRFRVPLPESEPWWMVFDADKVGVDEVCRVLAHLYSLPKAQYLSVCKEGESFTLSDKNKDSPVEPDPKEVSLDGQRVSSDTNMPTAVSATCNPDTRWSKDSLLKVALGKRKDSDRSDDDTKRASVEGEARDDFVSKSESKSRTDASEKKNEREQEREKLKSRAGTGIRTGGGGTLIGNMIDKMQKRTETNTRSEVVDPRTEEKIQKGVSKSQDITPHEIVVNTIAPLIQIVKRTDTGTIHTHDAVGIKAAEFLPSQDIRIFGRHACHVVGSWKHNSFFIAIF